MAPTEGANGAPLLHTVGSRVWWQDPKAGWVKAEVLALQGDELLFRLEDGAEHRAKADDLPLQNPGSFGVEDMTSLSYLNEPGVLWNLETRYSQDDIYTYTGPILIAVNPFASMPHLYGTHMMEQYRGAPLGDLSPHVYAIADASYRQMRSERRSQSILVSGESGAGKTETSKLIMQYLAWMGGYRGEGDAALAGAGALLESAAAPNGHAPPSAVEVSRGSGSAGRAPGSRSVEEQVLESNPLLEAFGNAKTVRNDNSSRFGKFTEIQFDAGGRISGAAIRTYLLERSRVVATGDPERNYHVFYQLCAGASPEHRAELGLRGAREHAYLAASSCSQLAGVSDAEEYARTRRAMSRVGLAPAVQDAVFRVVAAVLHLGDVGLASCDDAASGGEGSRPADARSEAALAHAARLLGVDARQLLAAVTTRTRQTRDGAIVSPLGARDAAAARDSLARQLYAALFDWLVAAVNASMGQDSAAASVIGVLDIYGFESFESNSFEQFCINLANEKLQQHFNAHVFKVEQAEYEREAIAWSYIQFVDNQDVLDLMEARMGVIDLLDECCKFPSSTPRDLAAKLERSPVVEASARFSRPRLAPDDFTIAHYAGDVTYETAGFLVKNRDFVVAEHQNLLKGSDDPFVKALFEDEAPASGGSAPAAASYRFSSVASRFKRQLADLMAALQSMEPHYVRCIKPNAANLPAAFEARPVLHQLRCGGVLEAVRISCAGYPTKLPYAAFADHFWPLAPAQLRGGADAAEERDRALARWVARRHLPDDQGVQFGRTKLFLRAGRMAALDRARTDRLNAAATAVARHARGWLARLGLRRARSAALAIQCAARRWIAGRRLLELRRARAALVLQSAARGWLARRRFLAARRAATAVQAAWRGMQERKVARRWREHRAATAVQAAWRGAVQRRRFSRLRRAAVVAQCAWRCRQARRELRRRRAEARDQGRLLQDKQALERRVGELRGVLENVQAQRNELRAALREERAAREAAEADRAAVRAEAEAALERIERSAEARARAAEAARDAAAARAAAAEGAAEAAREAAEAAREAAGAELGEAHERARASDRARELAEKQLRESGADLLARLNNAVAQRNAAREEALMTEARLRQAAEELAAVKAAGGSVRGGAAGTPGSQGLGTPLGAAAVAAAGGAGTPEEGMLDRVRRYMQSLPAAGGASPLQAGGGAYEAAGPEGLSDMERRQRELYAKQQALLREQRAADQERLLAVLAEPLGFVDGRPAAAVVVFRCCLAWRSFAADRTPLFDRVIAVLGGGVERGAEDSAALAYWLSNAVALLALLHKNIKPSGAAGYGARLRAGGASVTRGLFGGGRGSLGSLFGARGGGAGSPGEAGSVHGGAAGEASIHGGAAGLRAVEAKYPALLFRQQLDALVQKTFPALRDNVKREIMPHLAACIHASRAAAGARSARGPRGPASPRASPPGGGPARGPGPARRPAQQPGSPGEANPHWSAVLRTLDDLLRCLKGAHVPPFLSAKLLEQVFGFVNVQLFNQLLLRRECCSFSNGEYVKTGLADVEQWVAQAGRAWVGDAWEALAHIRQAVTFLVIHQKHKKSLVEIVSDLCPVLSVQQLYRISTMYWDDRYGTETVSHEVLAHMKQLMVQNAANAASHSFLLDEDSATPFSQDDIAAAVDDRVLLQEPIVPSQLRDQPSFAFLAKRLDASLQPLAA